MMKNLTKEHIKKLVIHFYQRVQVDDLLAPIFNDVAKVDWPEHIELLCKFWNSIMLKTNEYHGNAYRKHVLLREKTNITEQQFTRWLTLFQEEAFKYLPAEYAQLITQKAFMIADSLKMGMLFREQNG